MQASIRLDVLKAVRLAASREETRHYLNGVCVEIGPRGVDYIATDGNILLAYHSEVGRVQAGVDANGVSVYRPGPDNDLCGAWIIPDAIIDAIKVGKRDSTVGRLSGEGGLTLTISRAGSSFGFVAIDGIFPNWRRVMPRSNEFDKGESLSSNENITFNVDYLKALNRAGDIIGIGKPVVLPRGDALALANYSDSNLIGAIMPMRTIGASLRNKPRPAWIDQRQSDQARAHA